LKSTLKKNLLSRSFDTSSRKIKTERAVKLPRIAAVSPSDNPQSGHSDNDSIGLHDNNMIIINEDEDRNLRGNEISTESTHLSNQASFIINQSLSKASSDRASQILKIYSTGDTHSKKSFHSRALQPYPSRVRNNEGRDLQFQRLIESKRRN